MSRPPGDNASAGAERRICEWCLHPIPGTTRADAKTCSTKCRQARHRFRVGRAAAAATDRPMKFGYADPPYPGLARKYYDCDEVDHAELVARLMDQYPDGWGLSTSSSALRDVLLLCPPGVRVCPWVRGARGGKARREMNAWEPLIVYGGRLRREAVVEDLRDVLVWGGRQHSHPDALVGMKPAAFAEWLFELLGATASDTLDDLFPGSGAISRAWRLYTSREPRGSLPSRLEEARLNLRNRLDDTDYAEFAIIGQDGLEQLVGDRSFLLGELCKLAGMIDAAPERSLERVSFEALRSKLEAELDALPMPCGGCGEATCQWCAVEIDRAMGIPPRWRAG